MKKLPFRKIYIVDDSQMDGLLLKTILHTLKFEGDIIYFSNPLEAILDIKDNASRNHVNKIPEIIFLDLNMPEMHGFIFLDSLANLPIQTIKNCKVVIVTSSDSQDDLEKSNSYPFVIDYLIKPIQKMDFILKEGLIKLKLP